MSRILISLLFLAVPLLFSNCSKKTKVGFLMDLSNTGRWIKDKEIFIKSVEELGGEVVFRASEGDAELQFELANEILNEDVQVLVVIPTDMNAAENIVTLAHQKKVKVIAYDRIIRNCPLDFYISFDNINVGEMQAEYLTSICPEGNYVILGGAVNDNNSFQIRLGQLNIIQPLVQRGDIRVIFDRYADSWTEEEGYRLLKECMVHNAQIDAVLASNDQLAEGAIRAMQEAGVDTLPFISGQDADVEACRRILDGSQTMTVYKPILSIAGKTAEIAIQLVEEKRPLKTELSVNNGKKQVPAILLPATLVNRETIDLTVIADGYILEKTLVKDFVLRYRVLFNSSVSCH
jgi:D-xylose transport system substrate-binding protein